MEKKKCTDWRSRITFFACSIIVIFEITVGCARHNFEQITQDIETGVLFMLREMSLYETNKDKLDKIVGQHWEQWKAEGKDTTMCVIDFDKTMNFDWDTMVYFRYSKWKENKELSKYVKQHSIKDLSSISEWLHFLKNGKIVHDVYLHMASDDEKGVFFCTESRFIKRTRDNSCFNVQKCRKFYVIRDMNEEYVTDWRYTYE